MFKFIDFEKTKFKFKFIDFEKPKFKFKLIAFEKPEIYVHEEFVSPFKFKINLTLLVVPCGMHKNCLYLFHAMLTLFFLFYQRERVAKKHVLCDFFPLTTHRFFIL